MISRHSLRRLLTQLYQRKSDIESLICFLRGTVSRRHAGASRAKRYLRPRRELAAARIQMKR